MISENKAINNLIGHNLPCLPLQVLKRNQSSSKSTNHSYRWSFNTFQNPARTDGLKLKHWIRSDDQKVYKFAKFNTTSNVFSYSTDEYYHFLRDDDWTKEETDYLFDLLNTYDLRFPIVHDRYEFIGNQERCLDDLKARYYSICQKLIQNRPTQDPIKKQSLIQSFQFDKQREIERKNHVKNLLNRTKSQLLKEEFIYIETRRIEQNLLKRNQNKNDLIKLIGNFHHEFLNQLNLWPIIDQSNNNNQSIQQSRQINNSYNNNLSNSNNQIKKNQNNLSKIKIIQEEEEEVDISIGTADNEVDSNSSKINIKSNLINQKVQIEKDQKNCIYRFDSFYHPSHSISKTINNSTSGTHFRSVGLRSTRITLPKTITASTKISTIMNELKIPSLMNYLPKPLIMPTRENVESYERLIPAVNQLIEVKRIVDRVESELKNQRKKLDSVNLHNNNNNNSNQNNLQDSNSTKVSDPITTETNNSDIPSSSTIVQPIHSTDNNTTNNSNQQFDSNSNETSKGVDKLNSPTSNSFKLNWNKKRSASVASSCCSNNTGLDNTNNSSDQNKSTTTTTTSNNNNKARNYSNSHKKMRKN